jgi:hypothetical protein
MMEVIMRAVLDTEINAVPAELSGDMLIPSERHPNVVIIVNVQVFNSGPRLAALDAKPT